MRAVKGTEAQARALAAKVDASRGYPRCELAAGSVARVGGGIHVPDCACTDASAPQAGCPFATRTLRPVVELAIGWAYPVDDSEDTARVLTKGERGAVRGIDTTETKRASTDGKS